MSLELSEIYRSNYRRKTVNCETRGKRTGTENMMQIYFTVYVDRKGVE